MGCRRRGLRALILLDTHTLLWWLGDDRRLSKRAREAIAAARTIFVSPVSCWEVAMLATRGRIRIDLEPDAWVRGLFEMDRVEIAQLTPGAAVAAASLEAPFPSDPADRFIYATARTMSVPIVTKDLRLRVYARDHGGRAIW